MIVSMLACSSIAGAQPSRIYVGGTVDVVTQARSDTNPMGGTSWGGRALLGVVVAPHLSVEFEPAFNGSYSWQYSYRPGPSLPAEVVVSRRNTFFSGQARIRYGVVEPVVGFSVISGRASRHATIFNATYFDDSQSIADLATVVGVDAAMPLSSHVSLVPTIRMFVTFWGGSDPQTSVGSLAFRYGAGIRTTF